MSGDERGPGTVPLPEPVAWDWQRGDGLSAVSSSREISEANAAGMGGEVIPLVPLAQVEQVRDEAYKAGAAGERAAVVEFLGGEDINLGDGWSNIYAVAIERGEHL